MKEWQYTSLTIVSKKAGTLVKSIRVGGILDEHYTYLAGSEAGTTTTLPETYDTTAKGSSTKLSGYRYAYDERNHTIEGESASTFALNGFGVVTGAALFVKEEYNLIRYSKLHKLKEAKE